MNQIAQLETLNPVTVYNGGIDEILNKIAGEAKSLVLDVSTEKGRKEIASVAYKIARSKTLIDDMGKKLGEDAKTKLDAINADRKKARDFLDALKDEVRKPLNDFEEADKARIARHEANLAEIIGAGAGTRDAWQTLNLDAMRERLNEIEAERSLDWQEFKERAEKSINEATALISAAIAQREQYDAEQAELKRLREEEAARKKEEDDRRAKEEEDKRIQEAAARAVREAEEKAAAAVKAAEEAAKRAEQERLDAERRAESERLAAAERERQAAEKAKREAREAEEKAEREKQKAVEASLRRQEEEKRAEEEARAKREADKAHRARINNAIVDAIQAIADASITGEDVVKKIVVAIAKGEIPNLKITY